MLLNGEMVNCIYSAKIQGFPLFRMTTNNKIYPMQFCYNTSSTLLKQSRRSTSILSDGSRFFFIVLEGKNSILFHLITKEYFQGKQLAIFFLAVLLILVNSERKAKIKPIALRMVKTPSGLPLTIQLQIP